MTRLPAMAAAVAGLVVVALAASALPALGDPTGSSLVIPDSVAAGHQFSVQARFVQARGVSLPAGVPVLFLQTSGPASECQARFDPQFTITDATGTATVEGTLPPGCPGPFVLAATATGAGGVNSVSASLTETGGFPDTTTDANSPSPLAGEEGRPRPGGGSLKTGSPLPPERPPLRSVAGPPPPPGGRDSS